MTRDDIVFDARRWIGTPFKHQSRVLDHGGDCVAMVEWLGLKYGIIVEGYRTNYGPEPKMREIMQSMIDAGLERLRSIEDRLPGDVLFIQYRKEPQHLGILTPTGIVHGYSGAGCYVETQFNSRLLDGLRSVWRWPGIEN